MNKEENWSLNLILVEWDGTFFSFPKQISFRFVNVIFDLNEYIDKFTNYINLQSDVKNGIWKIFLKGSKIFPQEESFETNIKLIELE
jgi:hypothetical protein